MNKLPFLRLVVALALSAWMGHAAAVGVPPSVRQALQAAHIPLDDVAIWVQPVDAPRPTLAFNASRPMNPASVMKLVTAFAAFERLGPAYTWSTRVSTTGTLAGGVLDGDLHLTGGADPLLSVERVWKILRQVKALGVAEVRGDIVLDGSVLRLPEHDPAAFDGKALRPYNSGPWGLLVHFNTLNLTLVPGGEPGAPVAVAASPSLTGLPIDNRLVSGAGACDVWYRDLNANLEAGPAGTRLVLAGSLPATCGRRDWSTAPLPPERFAAAAVSALWAEVGGRVGGAVRVGATPPEAVTLIQETSPPLADVVREMNKWSSNVIARQLLASLGASEGVSIDMVAGGAEVARAQLAATGIDAGGLVMENGSGLSRIERVRAEALGQLLLAAWRRPYMPEFIAALPVIGVDGTARRRLIASPVRGQAHVKTGTIEGVRAIAGYILDRKGTRHAVVMMVNHPAAGDSQAAQDALLEWIWAAQ